MIHGQRSEPGAEKGLCRLCKDDQRRESKDEVSLVHHRKTLVNAASTKTLTNIRVAESTDGIQNMRSTMAAHSRSTKFDPASTNVKPVMFEKKTANAKDFFGLSDGFKGLFSQDKKDHNMRVPIAGYGGHTRGD